ncbi:MAG: NAD(P)H-dependent oxidoreductase [Granulosicoccus sp.]
MILVDTALEQRQAAGRPIRVGMIGAGFMARGIALQLSRYVVGFELVAIANRNIDKAKLAYTQAGRADACVVTSLADMEARISASQPCVTDDPYLICDCEQVDVVVEVTGAVDFGAQVVMRAIAAAKHVVMMNAELDGTLGPVLKYYADKQGVVITNVDGDQPGVIMNLFRQVKGMGIRPVLCGNIKGLQDAYRNPTTQKSFAERWKQDAAMVTSFADGTKISFEQALVANATDMSVACRGMHGPKVEPGTSIMDVLSYYPDDLFSAGEGYVDYVVGASPGPGVYVIAKHDDPIQQHYLDLYKLGTGPYYCFYTPTHLCHFEVHNTIARAVLFNDATIAPSFGMKVEVVATAKIDLKAGSTLDGIGHYMTYGQCENADIVQSQNLLPMGLAGGCIVTRDLSRDTVLSYDDVTLPEGRYSDTLRTEQNQLIASGAI